ncbi:MAG: RNase adapter RapZ, partial [Candidatus Humimicrobiaceae bacterium]
MKKVEKNKKRSQSDIELMILTGLSGAGKSEALGYFEDSGYYCIDNLPAHMLMELIDFFLFKDCKVNKIALSIDLRSGYFFDEIYRILEELKEKGIKFRILFLEASKSVITRRFSLTRR